MNSTCSGLCSIAMNGMRCAASRRATICPKRPKPAISTCGLLVRRSRRTSRGFAFGCARSQRDRQMQQQRRQRHRHADDGHQPVAQVARRSGPRARLRRTPRRRIRRPAPARWPAAAHRVGPARPATRPTPTAARTSSPSAAATPAAISSGSAITAGRSIVMPTAMKNRPEQQALERLDLRFELVAEFRIGQQHAGEERAQAHRSARPAA